MNSNVAQINMIKQQFRAWGVLDEVTLELFMQAPRHEFVPETFRHLAYADMAIPLAHGQTMLTPKLEAHMLQALKVTKSDTVLEIGTGSGFTTALLATHAKHVYSVDIFTDFTESAKKTLANYSNITLLTADAASGLPEHAPYEAIAITGSLPLRPTVIQSQLAIGGRLFAILGQAPTMHATRITRLAENEWDEQRLLETEIPALLNAPQPELFEF